MVPHMKDNTRVNHPPAVPLPADNRPLVAPIYQSVKFSFDDTDETLRYLRGERDGFFYSRSANPTLKQLQLLLAQLQGRDDCLLTGSGVATISASLLSLCKQGDHILAFVESYGPTRYIVQHLLAKFGVTHTLLSIEDLAGIERVLRDTPTRLVVFESPTNPVTKIADIEHLTAHARRAGALTVLDNTFAGFHNHGAYDIDVFLHSLTKYASGHGDVMGGAIIARSDIIAGMRKDIGSIGPTLDPHAAFLIQRGMRTYFLRYERQCSNALAASLFLKSHHRVKEVHYPGLDSHPQHQLARRQMRDFGTVVSLELDGGFDQGARFAEALELFSISASVGSAESLVMPPQLLAGSEFTPAQRAASLITRGTVRLSIGLEDAADLVQDLEQALDKAFV
ncbi:MAG TPA: aminotransferase class I/II-fold pyridoxal phosphate-dependent enzyme [Steroidobacteraceae bacterium]|jgi:cystathionine beta-lyase/cystathionine gamma-synthase|nr:aminotransferase class I/II-fold pyridoxal phosphate-dependent enzyme [Steroidobacteraceae bacterium]